VAKTTDIKLYDAHSQGVETPWDHTISYAIFILLILFHFFEFNPDSVCALIMFWL